MNPNKPATGIKVPDLYELLNLAAKEKDEQLIKAAMREFAERVKQIKSPEAAKQAAKLFAIAKQNLLDPARKAAYDSLWDKVYGSEMLEGSRKQMASTSKAGDESTDEEPLWDLTELSGLLPQGDSKAPLDLAAFLESTDSLNDQRSTEDLDRDFQRLLQLLGGEIEQPGAIEAAPPLTGFSPVVPTGSSPNAASTPFDFSAPIVADRGSSLAYEGPAMATPTNAASEGSHPISNGPTAFPPVVQRTTATTGGTRKKRKNRDSSLLLMIGGGVTILLGVLGVLLVMLKQKLPTQDTPQRVLVAADDTKSKSKAGQANNMAPVKGSGLPQPGSGLPQPGEGAKGDGATLEETLGMSDEVETKSPNMNSNNMQPNVNPTEPSDTTMANSMSQPTAATTTQPSDMPASTSSDANTATMPIMTQDTNSLASSESAAEVSVSLTDKEKSEWKKLLIAARQAMGKSDFDQARKSLDKAKNLAKSSPQKAQLGRLNTILPLVERFQEAMKSAASEMQASEVFTAGTQEISFVEASEERFIVRIRGANKRYQWDELPIVLAYGLVDLKLDQSPQTAAAKAAFAAVHSKINGTAKEDARKLMQVAAAAQVVPADTHEVFDDDYSLD